MVRSVFGQHAQPLVSLSPRTEQLRTSPCNAQSTHSSKYFRGKTPLFFTMWNSLGTRLSARVACWGWKRESTQKNQHKWHRHSPGSFPKRGQRNTHRRTWDCIKAPSPVPATPSKSASAGHCFLGFLASCNVTQVRDVPEMERKSLFTDPPHRQPTSPLLPAWATCGFVLLSPRLPPLGQKYRQDHGF